MVVHTRVNVLGTPVRTEERERREGMGERGRNEVEEPGRDRQRKGRVSIAVTHGGIHRQFTLQRYSTEGVKL